MAIQKALKDLVPVDPQREIEAAVTCASARAPKDYPTYYLLRAIAAALVKLVKIAEARKGMW